MTAATQEIYDKLKTCNNFIPNTTIEKAMLKVDESINEAYRNDKIESLDRDLDRVNMMKSIMNQLENVSGSGWSEPWDEILEIEQIVAEMKKRVQAKTTK